MNVEHEGLVRLCEAVLVRAYKDTKNSRVPERIRVEAAEFIQSAYAMEMVDMVLDRGGL